jgi:5,10-methenyltetrahydromethanopterin hydrogenase
LRPFARGVSAPSFIIASWIPKRSLSPSILDKIIAAAILVLSGTSTPVVLC